MMRKRFLSALLVIALLGTGIAHADMAFTIDTLGATLVILDDMEAMLLEDDTSIVVEIDDQVDQDIIYYIVYSYDATLKNYKHIKDMPKKLREQILSYYSNQYHGTGATIEKYIDGAPMLTVNGIGKDNKNYAMLVFFMNGMVITTYAIKTDSFTTYELSNVIYFAEEGLRSVVEAMLVDMVKHEDEADDNESELEEATQDTR